MGRGERRRWGEGWAEWRKKEKTYRGEKREGNGIRENDMGGGGEWAKREEMGGEERETGERRDRETGGEARERQREKEVERRKGMRCGKGEIKMEARGERCERWRREKNGGKRRERWRREER